MPISVTPPIMPDPSQPMVDANGKLKPEWVQYFKALDRFNKAVKAAS